MKTTLTVTILVAAILTLNQAQAGARMGLSFNGLSFNGILVKGAVGTSGSVAATSIVAVTMADGSSVDLR